MRIQHNIPAMNAYRNYNANTKALQGNLQKLSSGYKINKAGDDAAGLAISEKMRAQITGLEVAQKNAKDGISLVQTAEGAMTEIHTMLNRMFSLAEQSANGTYDDEVDRAQLQNEFQKLTDEIDRIADSTNFNGKKLLDGTLAGSATDSKKPTDSSDYLADISGALKADIGKIEATKTKSTVNVATAKNGVNWEEGDKISLNLGLSDGTTVSINLTAKKTNTSGNLQIQLVDDNGKAYGDETAAGSGATTGVAITTADVDKALKAALEDTDFGKQVNISSAGTAAGTAATNAWTFEAKEAGAGDVPLVTSAGFTFTKADGTSKASTGATAVDAANTSKGKDAYKTLDLSNAKLYQGDEDTLALEDAMFEIGGEKFVFVEQGKLGDSMSAISKAGVNYVEIGTAATLQETDIEKMVAQIKGVTGLEVEQGTFTAGTPNTFTAATTIADGDGNTSIKVSAATTDDATTKKPNNSTASQNGLRLRVGDSTNDYDDIYVEIKSLNKDKLEGTIKEGKGAGETYTLDKLNVSTDADADIAMGALKDMINYVSTERGTLGATQNRLDHTINNLSTMQENIQDAEATIRDVDVAEEMMKYTKNNILVQSAQAMLAQANQLPQGVLQLLG